jgi:chaperone required for assembly of F1-ATPase
VVTITGSLILALALVEQAGDPDTLWTAANIDEDFQAELWGADSLAVQALANKRRDYDAAVAFLAALRPSA